MEEHFHTSCGGRLFVIGSSEQQLVSVRMPTPYNMNLTIGTVDGGLSYIELISEEPDVGFVTLVEQLA